MFYNIDHGSDILDTTAGTWTMKTKLRKRDGSKGYATAQKWK